MISWVHFGISRIIEEISRLVWADLKFRSKSRYWTHVAYIPLYPSVLGAVQKIELVSVWLNPVVILSSRTNPPLARK